ncbi:GH32 C-terminal domain-containing protein [Lactiplantibacillus carotarum]|uniref:GH32 C-terminal domain-containing protein n=1 Tax=Lactiplantibacillus carotarum TaxID=2993456 RepID=UPI00298F22E0|nr:GH32 C-terminal domain-containing protein [Lactiplantibacillus carotarum]
MEGWQGCFSLVKALHVVDGQLRQTPVNIPATAAQFDPLRDTLKGQEVLEFNLDRRPNGQISLGNADEALTLNFNATTLTIDRQRAGQAIGTDRGNVRTLPLTPGAHHLSLWLDRSSFELFVDDGMQVASGRIFPNYDAPWRLTTAMDTAVTVTGHRLPKLY